MQSIVDVTADLRAVVPSCISFTKEQARGVNTFLDPDNLVPGLAWPQVVEQALRAVNDPNSWLIKLIELTKQYKLY